MRAWWLAVRRAWSLSTQSSSTSLFYVDVGEGLAPILAPLAGSWLLVAYGWQSIFWFKSIFASLCLLAVYFTLAETHHTRSQPLQLAKVLSDYGHLLINRTFMGYTLSSGLTFSGMFAYIAGSPHALIELHHISPTHYSWIFGSNAFGFSYGSLMPSGWVTPTWSMCTRQRNKNPWLY